MSPSSWAGGPIGTLDVYVAEPRGWDDSEVTALEAYGGVVASLLGAAAKAQVKGALADHLQLTEEELLETWEAAQSQIGLSLDRPVGDDADVSMGDLVAAPGPREEAEDLLALAGLIADLPELERQTIVLRYFQDLHQDAIAARLGYSQMHVSRLLRRALARLRAQLVEP